ncbi:TNT domain-containing protein [[Mycobacterium] nativiensis]|uniref:TNT domain-containing protein n=1 Tax=[Mycobacterium] nativiensis TaxID=2855503 RepID=A0ABU5Y0W1_9MYCO|nr:TNT domain-containing protein [Mycolicibacter sp. MYC340]MEB3032540.1 TNT domain-containing protein [Mycolicibacter sp. MYC340]
MTITTDGIEKWNLETLDTVFEIATERSARKAAFGGALGDAGTGLKDWEGRGGDAFRRELGKHRADIDDHQTQAAAIANAFYAARAEVAACKTEWSSIKSIAASNDWTISPDGRLSGQVTATKRNDFDTLQRRLTKLMADAGRTDQDLATAIRAVVGDTKVDAGGRAIFGPPMPGNGDKAPAEQSGDPAAGSLPSPLNQTRQGGGPVPPVLLNPKDVEAFKVVARQVLTNDGVPPDQIEAQVHAAVVAAQQPLPRYVPPVPQRGPAPGFGDGVGDRWRAAEQGVKNLLGQGGPGAPGVLESWGGLAKGVGSAMINPVGAGMAEVKEALDAPSLAYYLGEKTFDVGSAAATLPFGGEGAMVRAGLPAEVLTPGGAPAAVLRDWHPTGGMPSTDFEGRFGTPESRVWPGNDGFPPGHIPQPAQLPEGTIIDRFGSAGGRYLAPDGTPFADRSLAPELVGGNYNRYMITGEPLPPGWQIVEGPVEPYYGQTPAPGATQYMITAPDGVRPTVRELVKLGILDDYGPPLGR